MTSGLLAIIPAAGRSRRMGQPKLLLDIAGQTVIARVVSALKQAGVSRTLVVARSSDADLIREARRVGAELVLPFIDPAEMRQSVEFALQSVRDGQADSALTQNLYAGWILVPADHPTLNSRVIEELIAAWKEDPQQIAVPTFAGRRGHPTIFPWSLGDEVFSMPADQGLNQLLRTQPHRVREISCSDSQVLEDLDTPEDMDHICKRFASGSAETAE